MNIKPNEVALAVHKALKEGITNPEEVQKSRELRKNMAQEAGIIGNRAAIQRSLTGESDATESEEQRKVRLIDRGRMRLMQMGYSYNQATIIANNSYLLAKKESEGK